ncbi:MAG: LysR family transcriptional regulator [Chloroflexota bacterium]
MEIGQIEAFLAVVREGSFTNAATRLNLTQPSLSARIQHLEQSLGGELFHRDKRPVQLTPIGELFVGYAERAVGVLEAGHEAVRSARLGMAGRVTVCSPFSLATYLLPQVVDQFGQAHPQAELSIEAGHSDFAVSQLLDGVVNLSFSAAFPRLIGQTHTLLRLHDEMIAAVNPSHPLVGETAVSLDQLWHFRTIVIHWGSAFEAYIASLRQMSQRQNVTVRVPLAAALPMAHQPRSITFMPRRLAMASDLVSLNVPNFKFDWDAVLITRPGRTLTTLEQSFVDIVWGIWKTNRPN